MRGERVTWLVAVAAFFVVFHPIFTGKVLGAHVVRQPPFLSVASRDKDPRFADLEIQMVPWLVHASRELRGGHVPLWSPYNGAGAPFLANQQSAVMHPFTLLGLLSGARRALTVVVLLRWVVAFAGTLLLGRAIGIGHTGALAAASAYALSGTLLEWIAYPLGGVFAHLPLVLAIAILDGRSPRRASATALTLALASTILTGHFEYLPLVWGFAALAGIGAATPSSRLRAARRIALSMVVAALACAIFLLPCVEYLAQKPRLSGRPQRLSASAAAFPAPPAFQPHQLPLLRRSLGFWLVALASAGLASSRALRLPALTALSIVMLYDNPLARAIWTIPPLPFMQRDRLLFVTTLLLALMAGRGLESLRGTRAAGAGAAVALGLLGLLVILSPARQNPLVTPIPAATAVTFLAAALVPVIGLFAPRLGASFPAILIAAFLAERFWLVGSFAAWDLPERVEPSLPGLDRARQLAGSDRITAEGRLFAADLSAAYGIRDVRTYDAIGVRPYTAALSQSVRFEQRAAARVRLLPPTDSGPGAECFPELSLRQDPLALPRARLASTPADRTRATIETDLSNEVAVRVRATGEDTLQLADASYPGWGATLDGATAPILPDGPFRAVSIPPGEHLVRFVYAPQSYRAGLFVSAMTILLVAALGSGVLPTRP